MKKIKSYSIYTSNSKSCLFTKQFDCWEEIDWNGDLPPFFDRLNQIEDDRSFVILASSVIEYQIDRFLKAFIPNSQKLINRRTNLAKKIDIIRAFNLIPEHFPDILDIIRNIRNDFAHNLDIDSFYDSEKSPELPKHIRKMETIWNEFSDDMCYWSKGDSMRLMFKDIWRVALEGLRVFELNIRLFRQETEKREFINYLENLAKELKEKRKKNGQKTILKSFIP